MTIGPPHPLLGYPAVRGLLSGSCSSSPSFASLPPGRPLPSDSTSRWTPLLWLAVPVITARRGLSPSRYTTCLAHQKRAGPLWDRLWCDWVAATRESLPKWAVWLLARSSDVVGYCGHQILHFLSFLNWRTGYHTTRILSNRETAWRNSDPECQTRQVQLETPLSDPGAVSQHAGPCGPKQQQAFGPQAGPRCRQPQESAGHNGSSSLTGR